MKMRINWVGSWLESGIIWGRTSEDLGWNYSISIVAACGRIWYVTAKYFWKTLKLSGPGTDVG